MHNASVQDLIKILLIFLEKIAVAPWRDFQMETRYWVIVLSAVCGFWIVLAIFLATFCGPHQFTCHLCEEKIPRRTWQNGEHRAPCAQDHERFLYELPDATQKSAKCPTCGRTLKVRILGIFNIYTHKTTFYIVL